MAGSLFSAAAAIKQSALDILQSTQQLPVPRGAALDALAWGVGAEEWRAEASTTPSTKQAMRKELRTLVAASFDVYMRLQRSSNEKARTERELPVEEIVRASREYREALKTCVFALEDRMDEGNDAELVDLLKVSLAIWHLCELLFLQRRPRDDKWLAYELAAWLQEHYGGARLEELDEQTRRLQTLGSSGADQDPAFWSTVYGLVAMGCGAQAWSVLALHSSFRPLFSRESASSLSTQESFQAIQRLLHCMPGSKTHQQLEWQNWRDACQYLLNTDGYVRGNPQLKKLLAVMTADAEALNSVATTWYELMMAKLFLEEPKAIAHRFEFLMANCFKAFHPDNARETMNNFDCIILAILQYDVQSAVQDIHALGFHWMSAHLVDLLFKSNVIASGDIVEQYDCSLEQYFLLQYVIEIGTCDGLWQITTSYFEKCGRLGLSAIRSTLLRETLTSDTKTNRLLSYCHGKKSLYNTQRQIILRRSAECTESQSYAAALQWTLRGGHFDEVDTICDVILDDCEGADSLDVLNEAVEFLESQSQLAQTKKLTWLVKYRELNLVLDDLASVKSTVDGTSSKEQVQKLRFVAQQAAKRIQNLVASPIAPRRLRTVLLTHIEALLQESPSVLSSEQLFAVMQYLRSIERSFEYQEFSRNPVNQRLQANIQSLVSRRLTEAVLAESGRGSFNSTESKESKSYASLTAHLQLLPAESNPAPALLEFLDERMSE
ncbi:hypothetical protein Poli38472_005460 [Pythium oligandrum]|uniref:Nuclear pore complex protein Nup85 n=1 Tax=Pythium oligandrum TaxID=41045 RepID=A0A8K1CGC5_PYTOL|nr:hypothetical protein Poli38472_005460 [Pythium oligandrum]|eukprot:TMW62842.1 hypothetical protein Poli38472_005460 [Pythium oligandrum]